MAWKINKESCVVEGERMTRPPEGFDEWKYKGTHGCKVLSVGQGGVGCRPVTCPYTFHCQVFTLKHQNHSSIQYNEDKDLTRQC